MGNTTSSSTSTGILRHKYANVNQHRRPTPRLAMMVVAQQIYLKKVHILMLRYSMAKQSDDYGMIRRDGFERALARANLSNIEILDMLFRLWDDHAPNGRVPYREFCMGISPLACPLDGLEDILKFALRVSDHPNGKYIEWKEVYELLTGINSMASYFGDAHLLPSEIDEIVETVFEAKERISHEYCIELLSINPYVNRFALGKTRSNVRFREVLETKYIFDKEKHVTEYVVDCSETSARTSPKVPASSLSPCSNKSTSSSRKKFYYSPPPKGFVDVPLNDNDYFEARDDENSGLAGNSMASPKDPPSTKIRRRTSTSYSTYPRMAVSPSNSIPRDPP